MEKYEKSRCSGEVVLEGIVDRMLEPTLQIYIYNTHINAHTHTLEWKILHTTYINRLITSANVTIKSWVIRSVFSRYSLGFLRVRKQVSAFF